MIKKKKEKLFTTLTEKIYDSKCNLKGKSNAFKFKKSLTEKFRRRITILNLQKKILCKEKG